MKLWLEALIKGTVGLVLIASLLFLPAGSFSYFNGWLLIGLLFVPMLILGSVLLVQAPDLLKKRLGAKEKEKTQKAAAGILQPPPDC